MAKLGMQKGTILGKVNYAGVSGVQETKNGKQYVDYSFGIKLENGVSIFNKARLWNPEEPSVFTQGLIEKYDEIVENYKTEDIYIRKSVRPTKNKQTKEEKMSFDVFRSYVKKDGNIGFSTEGNLEVVESHTNEKEEVILTLPGMNGNYEVNLSDVKTKITAEMIIKEKDVANRRLTLVDSSDEFPLTVIGDLVEGMDMEKAKIGQGYKFEFTFEKGAKNETSVVSNGWEEEASESTGFAPDRVIITPLGIVKDLQATFTSGTAKSAPKSSSSATKSGLPF